jgi:hypothetical protein
MDKSLVMLLAGHDEKFHKGRKPITLPMLDIVLTDDVAIPADSTQKTSVNVNSLLDLWEDDDNLNEFHHRDATYTDAVPWIPPLYEQISADPVPLEKDNISSVIIIICFLAVAYLLYIMFAYKK